MLSIIDLLIKNKNYDVMCLSVINISG